MLLGWSKVPFRGEARGWHITQLGCSLSRAQAFLVGEAPFPMKGCWSSYPMRLFSLNTELIPIAVTGQKGGAIHLLRMAARRKLPWGEGHS